MPKDGAIASNQTGLCQTPRTAETKKAYMQNLVEHKSLSDLREASIHKHKAPAIANAKLSSN
jgi:ribosomal protein S26